MASIEFVITANYKEVNEAYARIDALKDLVKGFKADSPEGISIIGDINKEQSKIEKLVEEIRKLKQEQALQAQDAINNVKAQEAALLKLAQQYKDLSEQINNYSNATPPTATATTKTPSETSSSQSQAAESAKAQTMAFEELNRAILEVNGSLENNVTRLLRERAALDDVKKQLADLTKEEKANGKATEEQKRLRTELSKAEMEHKQSISSLRRSIENDIKLNQAAEGSMDQMAQALGRMRATYRSLNAEERNSTFGKSLLKSIQELDTEIKKLDASIGNHQRNVGDYSSALDNLSSTMDSALDAASALPGPIGAAASGIKTLTKVSLAFIATPVGAALAAIVAALAVLSSWFTRTEEGQNALNVASAYFKQTLDSILDVVDDVGEWLFNAFTKPKEALQDLSDFLEDQVMVRLKALGKAGEAIMKIFSGDYKQGFVDLGNAWLEHITGIEDAGKKALKFVDENNEKAQKRAALAERENKLAIEQRNLLVERSKLEAKINELREKSQDSSLTEKERLKALKEASVIINQMYEKEQKLAIENRDIIAETNKLSHSNAQAKDKEAKATAEINKLDAERASKNRELLSQQKEINNRIVEGQKKLNQSVINDQIKLNTERLALMEEGRKKRLALSEQEWKERKAQLDKEYQDTVEQYKKIGQEVPKEVQTTYQARVEINDQSRDKRDKEINKKADREFADRQKALTSVLLSEEAKRTQAIKDRYDKEREWAKKQLAGGSINQDQYNKFVSNIDVAEQKEQFGALLKDYATFQQNREKITKEYNDKINKMNKANAEAARKGEAPVFSAGNFEEAKRQQQEAYDDLDKLIAQRNEDFKALSATISNKTVEWLTKTIEQERAALASLTPTDDKSAESAAVLRAKIKVLEEQLIVQEKKKDDKDANTLLKWKKTSAALGDVRKATDDVINSFENLDDSTKAVLSAVSTVAGTTIEVIGRITTLTDDAGNSMTLTAFMASESISMVEKASVILTVISAALKIATSIISLFKRTDYMAEFREEMAKLNHELEITKLNARIGENEYDSIFGEDLWKNAKKNINAANDALQRFNETQNNVANRKKYTGLIGLIAEAEGVKNSYNSIAESVADMQIQIRHSTWFRSAKYQSLKDAVPELFNDNGSVNMDALEKFLGTDTFKKLSEENQKYLQEMSDYWKSYQEAIEEVRGYLTDIFGDLGNTMTDALVDAWVNGTDAAKSYVDSVSDMLETLAKQMVYSVTLGPLMKKAQQDMLDTMQEAGLTDEQKFNKWSNILNNLVNDAVNQQSLANKLLKDYQKMAAEKGFDIFTPDSSDQSDDRTAKAKGLASMSQDTGEKLDGKFTAGLIYLDKMTTSSYDIAGSIKELTRQSYDGWKNVEAIKDISRNIEVLSIRIADNTEDIGTILKSINKNTSGANESLDNMNRNGLYLKR